MITERTLRNWRRDALRSESECNNLKETDTIEIVASSLKQMNERILKLTQELMDLSLVRKGS